MSQNKTARRWAFTWCNYTDTEVLALENINRSKIDYLVFGREHEENDGTPHLQGYIELPSPCRKAGLKKLMDPVKGIKSKVHVKYAREDRATNSLYCKKGQQSHAEWEALKTEGPNYGVNAIVTEIETRVKKQGKRTDWDNLYEAIRDEPDFSKILEKYPEYAIKYSHGIKAAIETIHVANGIAEANEEIAEVKLRKWQAKLFNELQGTPHKEKIIWYVDLDGGCGKSTICDYVLSKIDNAMLFENGKTADIAHAWTGQQTCLFDFSRSNIDHINYGVIESLKNGRVFSAKYNSGLKRFGRPHIVCFSNFVPDKSKFSDYKWDIRYLSDADRVDDDHSMVIDVTTDGVTELPMLSDDDHSMDVIDVTTGGVTELPMLLDDTIDIPMASDNMLVYAGLTNHSASLRDQQRLYQTDRPASPGGHTQSHISAYIALPQGSNDLLGNLTEVREGNTGLRASLDVDNIAD